MAAAVAESADAGADDGSGGGDDTDGRSPFASGGGSTRVHVGVEPDAWGRAVLMSSGSFDSISATCSLTHASIKSMRARRFMRSLRSNCVRPSFAIVSAMATASAWESVGEVERAEGLAGE